MSDLTRHGGPRLIPFRLGQFSGGVVKVVHHQVVGPDKPRDLVIPLVNDIFKIVDACLVHLASHLGQRLEHLVHRRGHDEPGQKEQNHEQGDDRDGVQHGLGLEVEALVCERRAHDGDHTALRVEHRGVEEICPFVSDALLSDVVSLVFVYDAFKRVRIHP